MKKILFTLCIILSTSAIYAQRSNVSRADRLSDQEKPDFKGAREAIQEAIQNESTKDNAKTYYVAALIGYRENQLLFKEMALQKEVDPNKKGETVIESYNYFLQAYNVDQKPNKKGKIKPKFTKRIKKHVKEYYSEQHNLIGYGAYLFDNKKYDKAFEVFDIFLNIPKQPFIDGEISMTDSTYRMIKYYTAISATNSNKPQEAIKLYTDLLDDDYETKNVYQLLSEEYKNQKDTTNQINILKKGFEKYKNDPWFLQNIINIYINTGQVKDASLYLDEAIAQSPDIAEYQYVRGNIEERLGNAEKARKAFEKAIELDPKKADAYAGIGRLIYNQAVEILKKAESITDNKTYNEEVEKANTIFRKALPFMEKALEISPKDNDFKQTLKGLYYRLGENEKYDALNSNTEN